MQRAVTLFVSLLLIATACSGGGAKEIASATQPPNTASPSTAPPTTTGQPGSSEGVPGALVDAGFEIVDDLTAAAGGMQLWSYQVDNMIREVDDGAGYLGTQLDGLVGSLNGLPFSYLLAGWLSFATTSPARNAVEIMGDQNWAEAPSLVYPTVVLALFAADAVQAAGNAAPRALGPGGPTAIRALYVPPARPIAGRQALPGTRGEVLTNVVAQTGGVCSTLAGWVNGVLDFLFDALKVATDDDGFLGWLGGIWNAAVDLARDVLGGLIATLTAPIVAVISDALVVIGTLSMIASLLRPWNLSVEPSNQTTSFAVGDAPDVREEFVARVDTGIDFDWPASVTDCADVAGLDLPNPASAEGSSVKWSSSGFPLLGSPTDAQTSIGADNTAMFVWTTGREASDRGPVLTGTVAVSATVTSQQIEQLKAMLETLISGQLPVPPFGDIVAELFSSLTAPIFESLADLVRVSGSSSVTVIHHGEEPPEASAPPATSSSALDPCVVGTWVSDVWSMPGPIGGEGTGGNNAVLRVGGDGSANWDFGAMEPIVIVDDQIDVTTELSTGGSTSGTVSATAGVWDAAADTSSLEGRMADNIIGEISIAGGPGLYVGILDGSYTCSGDLLTVISIDPVEESPVTVLLHRR